MSNSSLADPEPLGTSGGSIVLLAQPKAYTEDLVVAFTNQNGTVIEPIMIGPASRVFVVPSGASQLQLGVVDGDFEDDFGQGFRPFVTNSFTRDFCDC